MPLSASRLAYTDAFDLMELALADEKGTRIKFSDYGTASHFRMRIHQARVIDRKENSTTYPMGHPLWGRSPYDILRASIRVVESEWWLYLIKRDISQLVVENLSEVDEDANTPINVDQEPDPEPATLVASSLKRRI